MKLKHLWGICLAGIGAGCINGLFGAGGGMVLVPLLTWLSDLDDHQVFPASVSIILPICLVSLSVTLPGTAISLRQITPYLLGSAAGGVLAGLLGKKLPVVWLHRSLGLLIIWGGIRYLC